MFDSDFDTGPVVMTIGIANSDIDIWPYLERHINSDWGDLDKGDKQMNDDAVLTGDDRILSAYETPDGKIWIITEWDRSGTTVLFPSEY